MKLIDYKDCELYRGTIFRFKGKEPFESIVILCLCYTPPVISVWHWCAFTDIVLGMLKLCYRQRQGLPIAYLFPHSGWWKIGTDGFTSIVLWTRCLFYRHRHQSILNERT